MIEFTYQIKDPNGMHARPAGKLATFAKQFSSNICVHLDGKEADAKRLLALMSLGAKSGAILRFTVNGQDEKHAADLLKEFLEQTNGDKT